MNEFTPGPWYRRLGRDGLARAIEGHHGPERVNVVNWNGIARPRSVTGRANAHLIAAAPELYEALEMVRDADEDCRKDGLPTIPPAARAKIDRALAKAEGKP